MGHLDDLKPAKEPAKSNLQRLSQFEGLSTNISRARNTSAAEEKY